MSAGSQSGWDVVSDEPDTPPAATAPKASSALGGTAASGAAQPEQKAGASDWGVVSDEEDKPQVPPQSATDFLLNQAPHSIYRAAQGIGHAVIHPIDTGNALGNLVAGTFKAAARSAGVDMPQNESDQVARNFLEYAKGRWGGVDEIKNALYHDPAGMLMDFSTIMSGAGGVLRGAGALSGVEAASALGRGVSKVGEIANPLYAPSKVASGVTSRLIRKPVPVEPPPVEVEPHPPFNPKTATFAGEEPFDPKTGTFGAAPGMGYKSPAPPQPPGPPKLETTQEVLERLRQERIQAKGGVKPQAPPPPPPPPPKPAAQPAAPPAPPPRPAGWKDIAGSLTSAGVTGAALEIVAHHLLGHWGAGVLTTGALKLLPKLVKSEAGQQMLAKIGPGSNAAAVASVARDLTPALNAMYQSQLYQQSLGQHSVLERAKGGRVNSELARLQREGLRLPGIHDMLQRKN